MKAVSIRMHCIPCYAFLRRLENVAKLCETTIPVEMSQLEEKTGRGIVTKAYEVANSDFYANIPDTVTIQSGANPNYIFDKSAEKAEIIQIMNEITGVAV
jgi:hypothetical protein